MKWIEAFRQVMLERDNAMQAKEKRDYLMHELESKLIDEVLNKLVEDELNVRTEKS